MKIDIKATNIELTKDVKSYILEKVESLGKFIKNCDLAEFFVVIGKPSDHHKSGNIYFAECSMKVEGNIFQGKVEDESIQGAIDGLKDILQREVYDFKEKKETLYRRSARKIKKLLSLSPLARFRKKN